ncbi:alpha-L-rhamnosidase [Dendryphion nanum]|uniref:alpha-L-rhamnosidase n=1 Tax=Dendryphion nanum TaxID=256645 RepID=A0A9P9CZD9_9PLEO|nr:alpha-L-rhamnosidase [Dendryphion nanum]
MSFHITSVTFEHHRPQDSIGIGNPKPRISWTIEGDNQPWTQASYEISVTRSSPTREETYTVDAPNSVLVPWPSAPLTSGESATVRVRATGSSPGQTTAWSANAVVEAGLLDRSDWSGVSLIKSPLPSDPEKPKPPVRLRTEFEVPDTVVRARLYATAHGVYEAHINGKEVGDHVMAPGWQSYSHRHIYQTFDVTDSIQSGPNALGVDVAEGWFSGRLGFLGGQRNIYGDYIGFIMKLVVSLSNGKTVVVVTGPGWKASGGEIVSSEIYDGEVWDLRQCTDGWTSPGYDDSQWKDAIVAELPSTRLIAPAAPPVRATQRVQLVKSFLSPSGKRLLDFGQNLVGRLRIKIPKGLAEGSTITISHAEVLENEELGTRPLRIAKCSDSFIFSAGSNLIYWEPRFTFHGFRYAQIDGWPVDGITADDIEAVVLHTDMQRTGHFECSEPLLNKLHENITWGMRGNFLSIPTDCPQRDERLGWTGDIAVFTPTASYLYDTSGTLIDWLEDVRLEQLENADGIPPLVVPDVLQKLWPRKSTAIWGDCTVLVPWDLFQAFGDTNILTAQYESIDTWLNKAVVRDETGLWATDGDKSMQLGDWLDPKAPPEEPGNSVTDRYLVADAFLVHSTELAAQISSTLGFHDKADQYRTAVPKLKKAFQDKYITALGRVVSDSQTAYALALCFSLFSSQSQVAVAAARLSNLVLESAKFKIATGFAGTPFISHALTKIGETQLFYRMLFHQKCPSWLYQVKMGATTMWERWDSMLPDGSINPGEMTSFNHYALGAVGNWMHKVIGGISPAEPGWRKVRIAPVPGADLEYAKARHLGPYGVVECEWKLLGDDLVVTAVIPPNSTAQVLLPGWEEAREVGSGRHEFRVKYEAKAWPPRGIYSPLQMPDDDI